MIVTINHNHVSMFIITRWPLVNLSSNLICGCGHEPELVKTSKVSTLTTLIYELTGVVVAAHSRSESDTSLKY